MLERNFQQTQLLEHLGLFEYLSFTRGDMSQIIKSLAAGPVPPTVATLYTEDTGTATPAANNLNLFGGTGIATAGSGSTITINVQNGGMNWVETSINLGAVAQTGYFCNAALTLTLPPTAGLLIGTTIIVYVDTINPVVIQANTGQFIQVGTSISSASGSATSTGQGDILYLIFKPSDLTWHTFSSVGTWTTI